MELMWNPLLLATFLLIGDPLGDPLTVALSREAKANVSEGCDVLFQYEFKNYVVVEGEEHAIKLPPLSEGVQVGYGFVYFTGQPEGAFSNLVLFLVSGYDKDQAQLFVDGNNNLDLSDDGPGTEIARDGSFLVSLHPAGKPDHTFSVRLRSYRDREKEVGGYVSLLESYIQRMGGKPTQAKYWFSETRLSTNAGDVKLGEISFRIGLHDYDCNGSFSDQGRDRILIGNVGQSTLSAKLSGGAVTLDKETLVLAQGQAFEIVEVDSAGKFLRMQKSDEPYNRLGPGMSLPSITLEMLDGEKRDLAFYAKPGRYLLLDFWGEWCQPCVASIPEMKKFQSKWKDKITVLGLHFGDIEAARRIIDKHGIDWDQAKASKALQERFLVDSWPFLVLIGPDGRILQMNTWLPQVETVLRPGER